MSDNSAIFVFTAKSIDRILREGGSASWLLSRMMARPCKYVVCTRNARAEWGDGHEDPYSAFLVGKLSDVIPCEPTPENNESPENRYLLVFSEYARIDVPNAWPLGNRNPIRYGNLDELKIDPTTLHWEKMPKAQDGATADFKVKPQVPRPQGLTILEAKRGLALTYGISPDAVEITIRA